MREKITGVVLAGGKSSRMGSDKGLLMYKGKLLIEHAIAYLLPYCNEILISTQNIAYEPLGYPLIPDTIKNIGPLGGIQACLENTGNDKILITACDIPEFPLDKLDKMCAQSLENDLSYLIMDSGIIQAIPLLLGKKVLPLLHEQIQSDHYKLGDFIQRCRDSKDLKSVSLRIDYLPKNINFADDLNTKA